MINGGPNSPKVAYNLNPEMLQALGKIKLKEKEADIAESQGKSLLNVLDACDRGSSSEKLYKNKILNKIV